MVLQRVTDNCGLPETGQVRAGKSHTLYKPGRRYKAFCESLLDIQKENTLAPSKGEWGPVGTERAALCREEPALTGSGPANINVKGATANGKPRQQDMATCVLAVVMCPGLRWG